MWGKVLVNAGSSKFTTLKNVYYIMPGKCLVYGSNVIKQSYLIGVVIFSHIFYFHEKEMELIYWVY